MTNERLLQTFLDMVRIYSPSGREAALAEYCARELEAAGCSVRFDDSAPKTGSDVGNMIAELPGDVPGVLVLSAHFDTVEPAEGVEPVISDGIVYSAGDTILGADDKAGLAAAIETVRRLSESEGPQPTMRCVFTVQEEVGLIGAKHLAAEDVECDLCLVLDADGAPGGIVIGAPTHYTFEATFTGKASHAGVAPDRGISAIAMASEAISAMQIGRLDEHTTANIGVIEGGTATNVVPATVRIKGECRSLVRERVEEVRESMDRTMRSAAEQAGGSVDIRWQLEYQGFLFAEDAPVVRLIEAAVEDVGLTPRRFTTGGGSDANILSGMGVPTLALGCGMAGVHSISEQLAVADLEALCALCEAVARRMADGTVTKS